MTRLNSVLLVTLNLAVGIALMQPSLHAQSPSNNGPSFKTPRLDIQETKASVQPVAVAPVTSSRSNRSASIEDLREKEETLQREIDYARTKLDGAKKKHAVQSAAGNSNELERLEVEIRDWEVRIKVSKDELATVQDELGRLQPTASLVGAQELIQPGENLEIFVNEDPSFNGRYQVRRGGYIIMPQVGRVPVAGMPVDQAERAVKRALEASQLTRATVLMERIAGSDVEAGAQIFLSGAFKNPRPYRIPLGTAPTLVSVILSCGGVTETADLTRVKIMRMVGGKSVVEEVNVQRILEGGGLTSDVSLAEGDVITIPSGPASLIYVTGNVRRQGSYDLVPGEQLSAYGAILRAGGFARFADEKKAHVLRPMPDGTKRKIALNLVDVKKGRTPDLVLEPNDIIVVPEKWFSF